MPNSHGLPVVSVVVLNWRGEDATKRCVASLRGVTGIDDCEIIVVDNESSTTSRHALAALVDVQLVPLNQNGGFAGGMNAGIDASRGSYIALLNNDLVVDRDWLQQGLRCLREPGVGIVGGAAFSWDGEATPELGGKALAMTRIDPDRGFAVLGEAPETEGPVAGVDGSNLLALAPLLRSLGGFDPDYFAYGEDVDLCARAWALGYATVFSPMMKVWHRRGASSDRVPKSRAFWAARNQMFTVAKHFPDRFWRRTVLRLAAENLSSALLGHYGGPQAPKLRALAWDQRVGLAWSSGWAATHSRQLRAKREQTIITGQHDESYVDWLRSLQVC
jgi:GT2 family glycosyltransferase